ncbi:xanthine phosphoribosyltransferase [Oxobacter pfennigii]|uniref:Xanthine phosphoribosyltransferase n=1 Tax=Oxobacter pfennigii TaxID=36849 RepID=A0A0P8WYX7_9CLOT|nr:xanthine phosphoribosyltransferase [Oxobacter pfennigii]KPU43634.1 xanthine phosphoribosyltransferase [Oxobacter pfennigii]
MDLLKERIVKEGRVIGSSILKVDGFLNHQIDIQLLNEIGREFKNRFSDIKVDKILTIESSGIGLACITAQYFNVPVVFAKKALSLNLDKDVYVADVFSYTKNTGYNVFVSAKYLSKGENVLIIDDFLANGQAALGLINIIEQAGATAVGVGIVIEKGFQQGRNHIVEKGIRLESLAIIKSMEDNKVIFE